MFQRCFAFRPCKLSFVGIADINALCNDRTQNIGSHHVRLLRYVAHLAFRFNDPAHGKILFVKTCALQLAKKGVSLARA
jgi:hypothetical protein